MEFQTGYYSRNYALPPTLFSPRLSVAKRANLSSSSPKFPFFLHLFPQRRTFLSRVEKKDRKDTAMSNVTFNLGLRVIKVLKRLKFKILKEGMFFKKLILSALHLFLSVSIVSLT